MVSALAVEAIQDPVLSGGTLPAGKPMTVYSPYSGAPVGEVATAGDDDIAAVLDRAQAATAPMRRLSANERAVLLEQAASICESRVEELALTMVAEGGKTIQEARAEVGRLGALVRYCAGEARRISGEVLPLDGSPNGEGRLGFTLKQPVGVVVAITPFNYPLLLVAHKVGPALAAGNPVVVKPSSDTPMGAFAFLRCFVEAGFPVGSVQCVVGSGSMIGRQLIADPRVRVVTFTGSAEVGARITRSAGVKRLLLELGANCPVAVLPDADIDQAAAATAIGGMVNAGQVCISPQRILVDRKAYGPFLDRLVDGVSSIRYGDPMDPETGMGAMISVGEARRVETTIREAVSSGARVLTGGARDGAVHQPTVVADVPHGSRITTEELFGPAVAVTPVSGVDEAISLCNDTSYGLGAGVFTQDLSAATRFAREVDAGNVHINWTPLWRVDPMPYGGLKMSGIGKEGPRYAIEEMMDSKNVIIHPTG